MNYSPYPTVPAQLATRKMMLTYRLYVSLWKTLEMPLLSTRSDKTQTVCSKMG